MRLAILAVLAFAQCQCVALDVPQLVKQYEPVVIKHESGSEVQILPWGTPLPAFVDESFVKRFDGLTIFGGPPGSYLVSGDGKLAIVVIQPDGPLPIPPGPEPAPGPGPTPPPDTSCDSVPTDAFNNVGKLACRLSNKISQQERDKYRGLVRQAYLNTASAMRQPSQSGLLTLNDAQRYLSAQLTKVFDGNSTGFDQWGASINDHIRSLQIDRSNFDDLCDAIARGLQ